MLVYGSRALRYHFPQFREPKDWDLVGTRADVERLAQRLPRRGHQSSYKVHFEYDSVTVEVDIAEELPFWARALDLFRDAPILDEPVLGPLRVPPPALVLFTKQCGLIYGVLHWHKNLEDLYQLQQWITEVPPEARELLRPIQEHSRSLHGEKHAEATRSHPDACHPKMPTLPDAEPHRRLHEHMKLGARPMVDIDGAWQAFPRLKGDEKLHQMRLLFAEEAMVLAATIHLKSPRQATNSPAQLKRAALRTLIQSALPEAWRYFGINNYREIAALIPEAWQERIADLEHLRPDTSKPCIDEAARVVEDSVDQN
ncbi:MAG TPA: hypothetical protein VJU61_23680 [Polyangiaceae bacterium]|nr:hypothetical protein [Polyangiaceae bacterium]